MILEIRNLCAEGDGKPILKGVNLVVRAGEIHAIMGPNGAGKSTLGKVLAGHPGYEVTEGSVTFLGQDLLAMAPEDRARAGLFLGFQYPVEVPGLRNDTFLFAAVKNRRPMTQEAFATLLAEKRAEMAISDEFDGRGVNEGFSGGEKKRSEILQMALLDPDLAVLDETDSGLDIDAMKVVAAGVHRTRRATNALILITHYQRLLDLIRPDFVHVFADGKIVQTAGPELALALEAKGYEGRV